MAVDRISEPILRWYDAHARVLPWRQPPGARTRPDPYRVWLSEIMLQQTGAAAVAPRFSDFVARWPTVADLAAADDGAVMAAWAGLGYYARARNLLAAARNLAADGFPTTSAGLRRLPGVGPYTAAAIAAIAFGERALPVDTNIARVGARLFALAAERPALADAVRHHLGPHVPAARPGDFAQSLMDLGARICTPRTPDCPACPLRSACAAHAAGAPESFPPRRAAARRPTRHGHLWWIEHGPFVALVRRPPAGLLGGMLGLPGSGWTETPPAFAPPVAAPWRRVPGVVRHVFTHFELRLHLHATRVDGATPPEIGGAAPLWTDRSQLADAGLPTLYRKAVEMMTDADAAWPAGC